MNPDATGTSTEQQDLARRRRRDSYQTAVGFGLMAVSAYGFLIVGLIALLPGAVPTDEGLLPANALVREGRRMPDEVEYDVDCDLAPEIAVVSEEPVIVDEPLADEELPYQESFGETVGLSGAPFEGPANNGTIGIGGGAGGAFAGRGGCCDRGFGAGGGGRPPAAPNPVKERENRAHRGCGPRSREAYDRIHHNPFRRVGVDHTSTFSIDVDTASYANIRRFLREQGQLPPKDAVRIEEMLNYFPYAYEPPARESKAPFRAHVHVATCPWNPQRRLARIAIKGRIIPRAERPPANLVFLLDVSGSMRPANKLPLLKASMAELVRGLEDEDRVAIVVYAGAAGLVLPSTPGSEKETIQAALGQLDAGGSTNGGAGIELAYRIAANNFIEGGTNRVILATDGDFNVGVTNQGDLTRLIEKNAKTGVFLSALGFGTGNYQDSRLEAVTNIGNGNYAYIDSLREGRKVLVEEAAGTLITIAKDVKIQVFFNPDRVAGYRLIGYENRLLKTQDFNDDKKDAGEIGAGHAVTALYEIVPKGEAVPAPGSDPNPFIRGVRKPDRETHPALFRLRLRYKQPDGARSTLLEEDVTDRGGDFENAGQEFRWAAAVAAFGMLLRDSEHKGNATWENVYETARNAVGADPGGYRKEFLDLVKRASRAAVLERG